MQIDDTPDDFLDLSFGEQPAENSEDLNIEDMDDGTEVQAVDLSGSAPATVPVTAPTEQNSPAPAQQQPNGQTPPVPAAAATPAPQQGQQPPAQEQAGATTPQQVVDIEQFVSDNADAIIGNLAKTHFAIPAADAEALGIAPEVGDYMAKRDAKNFLLTMVQVNQALQRTLPTVVANLVQLTSRASEAETGFYNEFPELKGVDGKHLRQIGATLRAIHPNATREQFQTLWGTTAMTMLGIQKAQPAAKTQANGGRTVRRGQPQPFVPAGAVTPQRNMGGGQAQVLTGIDAINANMQKDFD